MAIVDALKGLSLTELKAMRSAAVQALGNLHTGARVVSASGVNGRSLTYTQSSAADLERWVNSLNAAIRELEGAGGPAQGPVLPEWG